jgi:hypothetical protein
MRHGISLESIRSMSEKDVMEFSVIFEEIDKYQMDQQNGS